MSPALSPTNMNEIQQQVCDLAPDLLGYPAAGVQLRNQWGSAWLWVKSTRADGNWFRAARLEWDNLYRLVGADDTDGLREYVQECLAAKRPKARKRK